MGVCVTMSILHIALSETMSTLVVLLLRYVGVDSKHLYFPVMFVTMNDALS